MARCLSEQRFVWITVALLTVIAPVAARADSTSLSLINLTGPIADYNGAGVQIGQIDESVPDSNHVYLLDRIVFTASLYRGDPGISGTHGTEVAGVMVSTSTVTRGVAPGAVISALEIGLPDSLATGTTRGIDAAFFLATNRHVSVINQSYGWSGSQSSNVGTSLWERALDNLVAVTGVTFVQAAGNNGALGANSIVQPASAYNVITVGSVTNLPYNNLITLPPNQIISSFSSRGPLSDGRTKPDLVAPGGTVIVPTSNSTLGDGGDGITNNFGTSYAAPHVAGVVALLTQVSSNFVAGGTFSSGTGTVAQDPRTVKAILLNSATKLPGWTQDGTSTNGAGGISVIHPLDANQGAGLLNAAGAYSQLADGQHIPTFREFTNNISGGTSSLTNPAVPLAGWDLHTVDSGTSGNFYQLGQLASGTGTVTLTWYRNVNGADNNYGVVGLNNLDLILWRYAGDTNGTRDVFAESISSVDNVEQLYFTDLPEGFYAFQIVYSTNGLPVTLSEQYATAWDFGSDVATIPEPSAALLSVLSLGIFCLFRSVQGNQPAFLDDRGAL
jgi:subtilisin family serine protease